MNKLLFQGRQKELERLNDLLQKKTASLVVIKGRRRIGKSRLIEEFADGKKFYKFSGLPPIDDITAQDQRDEFIHLLHNQTDLPEIQTDNWSKIFSLLASIVKTGRVIILFDEITWMAHGDPTFLAKLKNAWDLYFSKNPKLILILCGSVSAWIEKNILSSTGYFGRISQKITLRELPLHHCNAMLKAIGFNRSQYEKFLILSLTGGVPWYIEQINPALSASENIKKLCFESDGTLVDEHTHIFHDLFGKRSAIYEKITQFLSKKSAKHSEISKGINYASSGALSNYLNELLACSYISHDYSWSFKSGQESIISTYRLSDNYLRFYYKYVQPRLAKIRKDQFTDIDFSQLPGWTSMIGLQFENLVLSNRKTIQQALRITPESIVADNPYFQPTTKRYKGCQIDYLIHTQFNTLFVCEIKFSRHAITTSAIREVEEKIERLVIPRGFTCIPVLIHINGVTDAVLDTGYFHSCIDFTKFLL